MRNKGKENLGAQLLAKREASNGQSTKEPPAALTVVESVFRCKWSTRILACIREGQRRPGEIERAIGGLTNKVLNDCMRRLIAFGIVKRKAYPEIPPRVEYELTGLGEKFVGIIKAIEALEQRLPAHLRK